MCRRSTEATSANSSSVCSRSAGSVIGKQLPNVHAEHMRSGPTEALAHLAMPALVLADVGAVIATSSGQVRGGQPLALSLRLQPAETAMRVHVSPLSR